MNFGEMAVRGAKVRWLRSRMQQRPFLAMLVVGASLVVAAGSASAVIVSNPHTSSLLSGTSAAASSTWTTPPNEANAPQVSIPGGAASGGGNFNDISCFNSTDCVAVGGDNNLEGLAAVTSDGGSSWSESVVASGLPELNAVDCPSATLCVAVGNAGASNSSDGGSTWQAHTIPSPDTTLLGVSCATVSTCVAVGVSPGNAGPYFGAVLLSTNGGASWTIPTLPADVGALGSVSCPSATFCVAVGDQILTSDDGGQSWNQRFVNGGSGVLRSVSCSSPSDCVAIGPNPDGLISAKGGAFEIVSTDDAATWSPISTPAGSSGEATIQCVGADCVASGSALTSKSPATIIQTSNSGISWNSQALSGGLTAIGSFNCPSASTCVFTGREGTSPVVGELINGAQSATSSVVSVVSVQNASAQ